MIITEQKRIKQKTPEKPAELFGEIIN